MWTLPPSRPLWYLVPGAWASRIPSEIPIGQKLSGPPRKHPTVLGALGVHFGLSFPLERPRGRRGERRGGWWDSHCSTAPAGRRGNVVQVKSLLHRMQSSSVSVFWGVSTLPPGNHILTVVSCLCIAVSLSSWGGGWTEVGYKLCRHLMTSSPYNIFLMHTLFTNHNNSMRYVLLFSPFYRTKREAFEWPHSWFMR